MEIGDVDVFNSWILPIIKPICLADPDSLARYVVVLLKKSNPKPDLRSYCIQNLSIFIDCNKIKVEDFVDMVLDAVENKKYCPEATKESKDHSSNKHSRHDRQSHHRPSSKHSGRSRSRSPVSNRRDSGHSSRKSTGTKAEGNTNNNNNRKPSSNFKRSRSRSRSDRDRGRSRSPHSRSVSHANENVAESQAADSKKSGSSSAKICPSFEKEGYCLTGDSCTYSHPGFLQVEEKDIQAIAATYQAAAAAQLLQQDPTGNFTPQKSADFSQQVLNNSPKNAHISPVLASYLQMGFQQIAAAVVDHQQQQQQQPPFLQQQPDMSMYAAQYGGVPPVPPVLSGMGGPGAMAGEDQPITSVPVVMSSRLGGFPRRDQSNLRQIRRSGDSFGAGAGGSRRFGNGDNRFGERPAISASQLDNEMDEMVQQAHTSRLEPENPPENMGNSAAPEQTGQRNNYQGGGGGYNRPFNRGRGSARGGFHRGGRMGRGGGLGGRPHMDMSNNILEVRKIPANLNGIGSLHEHFSKFGPISNIQVSYENDPEAALVTFQNHGDALNAYRSAQPLFNNRFIRVFWHHKDNQPGAGEAEKGAPNAEGANAPADASGDAAQQAQQRQAQSQPAQPQQPAAAPKPPPRAKMRIDHASDEKAKVTEAQNDLAKRRRLLLANYLEMRKNLSDKLQVANTDALKADVSATLKTVDDKIASLKVELGLVKADAAAKHNAAAAAAAAAGQQPGQQPASSDADPSADPSAAKGGPKTPADRASFIVDRRPKQLLVQTATGLDASSLRSHFGLFCSVDGVELSSAGYVVTFTTRRDAEIAKARGLVFRGQQVSLAWHQPTFFEAARMNNTPSQPKGGNETAATAVAVTTPATTAPPSSLFDDADSDEEQQQQPEQQQQHQQQQPTTATS